MKERTNVNTDNFIAIDRSSAMTITTSRLNEEVEELSKRVDVIREIEDREIKRLSKSAEDLSYKLEVHELSIHTLREQLSQLLEKCKTILIVFSAIFCVQALLIILQLCEVL